MAERQRSRARPSRRAPRDQTKAQTQQDVLQRWAQRVQMARALRSDWANAYQVDALAKTFNGDTSATGGGLETETAQVLINRFWPTIKAQIPGLLWQAPKFFVRPTGRRADTVAMQDAAAGEALLSSIASQDDHLIQEAKLALQQSFWAVGVLKCLYDPRTEPNPQRGAPMYLLDAQGDPVRDPLTGTPVPLFDTETGEAMTEPGEVLNDELYRWQWVHWSNMLFPDAGPAMLRWPWIAEEMEVPLDVAKADERYPAALRASLVPNRKPQSDAALPRRTEAFGSARPLDEYLWIIDCWDMRAKRHYHLAEGQPFSATQLLLDEAIPEGIEDHPYSILPGYTPKTDPEPSPWPIPHCWNWLGVQQEYQARREQGMNAARRSARKYYYDQATFPDVDNASAALDSNKDMEGVLINDINKPPLILVDPGSPPDITRDLALLEKDWLNTTGTPGERIGPGASDTATQAIISDRAATMREGEMKNAVTLWMTTAGKKMHQLCKGTMILEHWVKIRDWTDAEIDEWLRKTFGPQMAMMAQIPGVRQQLIERYGREKWMAVTREQLAFEADVGVVPGSTRSRTMEADRQQTLLFLRTLAEVGGVMPTLLTSRRFLSHLADIFEVGDDLLVDELVVSVQKHLQMQAQAQQRSQQTGGGQGDGGPTPAQMESGPASISRLQSAMMNGGF